VVHQPAIIFFDEPTTGLDPQNRARLWEYIRGLKASGTTVVLTTHYLDEADCLADHLWVMDHGEIIAQGTPAQLKADHLGDSLDSVFLSLTGRSLRDTEVEA
jgi:ABC-2 type transport system ATP-binding protein